MIVNLNKFIFLLALLIIVNLHAQAKCGSGQFMQKKEYKKAVFTYVSVISRKIAKQLDDNIASDKKASLYVYIEPIVNLYEPKKASIATKKIDENLLHAMFIKGFKLISVKSPKANSEMIATYINYKSGMLINARIIDKKTKEIYTSAQIFVTKKELKSINKIYGKYSWFSQN